MNDTLHLFSALYQDVDLNETPATLWLGSDGPQKLITFTDVRSMAETAVELGQERNVYFTVNPLRQVPERQKASESDIARPVALYVDLDFKKDTQQAVDNALAECPISPTAIIDSGNGRHAYWVVEASEQDPYVVKERNKAIEDWFRRRLNHVDTVSNLDRVLRVPGTWNYKVTNEQGRKVAVTRQNCPEPLPVKLVGGEIMTLADPTKRTVHDLDAIIDGIAIPKPEVAARREPAASVVDPGLEIDHIIDQLDSRTREAILTEMPEDRSGQMYGIACSMFEQEWPSEAVRALLSDVNDRWDKYPPRDRDKRLEEILERSRSKAAEKSPKLVNISEVRRSIFVNPVPFLDGTFEPPRPSVVSLSGATDGLFYPGVVNGVFGHSGGGKSLFMQAGCVTELAKGNHVVYLDLEDIPARVFDRVRKLGASDDQIRQRFHYAQLDNLNSELIAELIAQIVPLRPSLIVIDGVTNAMQRLGLNLLDNNDVSKFDDLLPSPLARQSQAAVVTIDHVVKNNNGSGGFAIGAGHKRGLIGGCLLEFVVDKKQRFAPGRTGKAYLKIAKDRGGALEQRDIDYAAFFHLDSSNPNQMVFSIEAPSGPRNEQEGEDYDRKLYEERVIGYLSQKGRSTKSDLKQKVKGRTNRVMAAINHLSETEVLVQQDNYIELKEGWNGTRSERPEAASRGASREQDFRDRREGQRDQARAELSGFTAHDGRPQGDEASRD